MTFHHHQRYLSEVGSQISRFAAPSEVVFIQEEIAHHLEEQTYTFLDQGYDNEKSQLKSLQLLGSSSALARSIRRSFRGALWMIHGSSAFAVSAVALAVPLRDLTSKGVLIQALSLLFSIGAFALAAAGCGLGAKMSYQRIVLTLAAAAVLFFLAPQPERSRPGKVEPTLPSGKALLKEPPDQDLLYAVSDGRVFALTAADQGGVSNWRIEPGPPAAGTPPLPERYQQLLRKAERQGPTLNVEPKIEDRDSYLVWAWVLSMALITGGAFSAAAVGEKKRSVFHKRQAPPPHPQSQNSKD